ncbi:hypothetical protein M9Y10_034657 [Tritrichomonas musculus]|uniref:RNA polymerase sigma factor 54 DNA-binding domain-containing protein n=1 Tax=Tritrichomonas musculus TaxID=1915356 RepID=A0ABR2KG35_9EUKA
MQFHGFLFKIRLLEKFLKQTLENIAKNILTYQSQFLQYVALDSQIIKQLTNEQQKSHSTLSCAALEKWIQIMNQLIPLKTFFYTREWKLTGSGTDGPRSYSKIHHRNLHILH